MTTSSSRWYPAHLVTGFNCCARHDAERRKLFREVPGYREMRALTRAEVAELEQRRKDSA